MKEFRNFLADWIETGFKWYQADPELITKYKFGHDYNQNYSYRRFKKELPPVTTLINDTFNEVLSMLIAHCEKPTVDTDTLVQWLRQENLERPPSMTSFFVKEAAYAMYHLLQLEGNK